MKKTREVFQNSFFTFLQTALDDSEIDIGVTNSDIPILDAFYFGGRSGNKYVSPMVNSILQTEFLTDSDKTILANIIVRLYGVNWAKQYNTLLAEYNPIENYSMVENMSNDVTTIEYDTENTQNSTAESQTDMSTFGFNSVTDVDSDKQNTESTGETVNTKTGTDTHTHEYELTRKGNIGVTTSQQMLQSERDLWSWNFLQNVVFPDIDSVITLKIY